MSQERKVVSWTIEETQSVLLRIKKKILQLDPKINPERSYNDRDYSSYEIEIVKDRYGRENTKHFIGGGHVDFTKQSAKVPDEIHQTSQTIEVVPIRGGAGFFAIKLSIGHTRNDYRKDSIAKKLEKRITPKSTDKLDEIVELFVTELQRRFKILREKDLKNEKELKASMKLSKIFPDLAESLGFGRRETDRYGAYGIEGTYLNIKKDFNGTEIELQQRPDGDFNIRIAKIDEKKVKELLERLK